jgi:transposase
LGAIQREIDHAKRRFGLAEGCRVLSCYEAGRDGFWLHFAIGLLTPGVLRIASRANTVEVNGTMRQHDCKAVRGNEDLTSNEAASLTNHQDKQLASRSQIGA